MTNRGWASLALVLLTGIAAYFFVGQRHASQQRELAELSGANLAWLRAEFALDDAQFRAIAALHETYGPACAKHCADIVAASRRLEELRQASAPAAELAAATQTLAALEAVCNQATREHVRRVAAAMAPEQGRRYLDMIEPHLAQLPHDGVRAPPR